MSTLYLMFGIGIVLWLLILLQQWLRIGIGSGIANGIGMRLGLGLGKPKPFAAQQVVINPKVNMEMLSEQTVLLVPVHASFAAAASVRAHSPAAF